jgi:ferredoxin
LATSQNSTGNKQPPGTMKWYFIPSEQRASFYNNLSEGADCIVPELIEEHWHWKRKEGGGTVSFSQAPHRVVESLKTVFFTPRESVGGDVPEAKPLVLFGIKNCDLLALKILDTVFLEGAFVEPFYAERRAKTLIVADDCTDCLPSCFCVAVGHTPYPEGIADIIVSHLDDGDLVAAATEKGESVLAKHGSEFNEATVEQCTARQERRKAMETKLRASLREQEIELPDNLVESLKEKWSDKVWDKISETCVECGACNFVCPSCHCFFLRYTKNDDGTPESTRVWDACLSENFSKVAGGANPNKQRQVRLRHRIERKFIAPYESKEGYACTGCGRCADACLGRLDIRKILQEIAHA